MCRPDQYPPYEETAVPFITLLPLGPGGFVLASDDGQSVLVQSEYDYCDLARWFGWSVTLAPMSFVGQEGWLCRHADTDGTIPCGSCWMPASLFIESAREYLIAHLGERVEDPGYLTDWPAIVVGPDGIPLVPVGNPEGDDHGWVN